MKKLAFNMLLLAGAVVLFFIIAAVVGGDLCWRRWTNEAGATGAPGTPPGARRPRCAGGGLARLNPGIITRA